MKAENDRRIAAEREKAKKDARKQLAADKLRIQREADKKAQASVSSKFDDLRRQLKASEDARREVQKREAAIQKRESLLKTKEQDIQKQITRAVETTRKRTELETREEIEKENYTRELQQQKTNSDLKKQLAEMKRKLEQSSQQSQGEVMELELEKSLKAEFPADDITRIAKGKFGADILHKVMSPNGQHCGTIVWESKNSQKGWKKEWLTKLRSDQRREKAEIAVIVSSILPKNMRCHFGQVTGVWVTDFSVASPLATALRVNLIELARYRMTDQGKSEKMAILYRYLISTGFRQRVEAIVEAFSTMKDDLDKEKQAIEKGWAKREKHLNLVLQSVSGMVGDIQAITPAFPRIKRLELPVPR
jgi:hypothetical protein